MRYACERTCHRLLAARAACTHDARVQLSPRRLPRAARRSVLRAPGVRAVRLARPVRIREPRRVLANCKRTTNFTVIKGAVWGAVCRGAGAVWKYLRLFQYMRVLISRAGAPASQTKQQSRLWRDFLLTGYAGDTRGLRGLAERGHVRQSGQTSTAQMSGSGRWQWHVARP